jgi:excisionase family DNA binding protein
MADEILTADEVGRRLCLSKGHVYELARAGEIPHVRIGKNVRFRWSSVEAWFAANESGGQTSQSATTRRTP